MQSVRFEESNQPVARDAATPFRAAFAEARREAARALDTQPDASQDEWQGPRFEARIEKRRGSRSKDVAHWNQLGWKGWELVAVNGKHATFRRAHR